MRFTQRGTASVVTPAEVKYFCKWVLGRQLGKSAERLKLKIVISNRLRGCLGEAASYPEFPDTFLIALRTRRYRKTPQKGAGWNKKLTRGKMLRVLAHELRHVKQFSTGELRGGSRLTTWRKKLYDEKRISYYKQPWELDAKKCEWPLFRAYERHLRRSQLTFG